MSRPSADALRFAAEWLRAYDEEAPEAVAAAEVAEWLDAQADAADVRNAARNHGVTVQQIRAAIARAEEVKP